MDTSDEPHAIGREQDAAGSTRPLTLIVGEDQISPCSYETFSKFKIWIVKKLTDGKIDCYSDGRDVSIHHWDDQAGDRFPHLLNPCECGTFLPMEVEPGPLLSSAIGLMSDLKMLKDTVSDMPADYLKLVEAMMGMAEKSIALNQPLEIR